jgi:glutaminyl-peptide cyclotransferase
MECWTAGVRWIAATVSAPKAFGVRGHALQIWAPFVVLALALGIPSCRRAESPLRGKEAKIWQEFSGNRALDHVKQLVAFGPRPPGSEALEKSRGYITNQLAGFGWAVTRQTFEEETPRGKVAFTNLIAKFAGADGKHGSSPQFLLCSHYDTKIFDQFRFVGANDGGSSTGELLEMARVLSLDPSLASKIELVFFDGEEAFEEFSDTDGIYGSRYFANQLVQNGSAKQFRGGILFDMVGDRSLDITIPPDSPVQITRGIFASASALKLRNYFTYFGQNITDDHTPLNTAGVPTIDLIDFDYPPWHTAGDTIDKLSPQSLQIVGSVAAYYLSNLAFK